MDRPNTVRESWCRYARSAVQGVLPSFARHRMKSIFRRLSRFASQALAGGGVIALTCAIGPGAQAQVLGPLVQVAGGDPFSGCTADQVHAQESAFGSILYPATSIEPWAAADPTNPSR